MYCYSANPNLERYLFRSSVGLLELARLYAPDDHEPNLLTRAIAISLRALRRDVPQCEAVVSFADPEHGHFGGVYQAASWLYTGRSMNPSAYRAPDGQIYARRSFHDKNGAYRPSDFIKVTTQAKHRYVKLLTRKAHKLLKVDAQPYPKSGGGY